MRQLDALAARVDDAALNAVAIPQLSLEAALSLEEAYEVQRRSVERRLARGERRVGYKMGLTSRAKMVQVGVHEVIWGQLTDAMREEDGGVVRLTGRVHPRVEPEVAFLLKRPLSGRVSPAEALAAVEAVAPAMEVIDSRYRDFQFALPDVVADNASSSGFVLGAWCRPDVDLSNLGIVVEVDGRPVQFGSSAAILGHPLRSLAAAARLVEGAGLQLEAGHVVLAGGATAAEPLRAGRAVRTVIERLGQVSFTVGA